MKSLSTLGLIAGVCFVNVESIARSASDRTAEIFNRNNRVLQPPARSLRSDSEDMNQRVRSEERRLDRLPTAEGTEGEEAELESTAVRPMPQVKGQPSSGPRVPLFGAPVSNSKTPTRRRDRYSAPKTAPYPGFDGDRIFALGFVGAGAYGVFGVEVEFSFDEKTSVGMGLGTGMTYSTWGLHAKYFFNSSGRINTFFQAGYANWYMGNAPSTPSSVMPNYLAQRFFYENGALANRKRAHLIYPAIGVQFQHRSGLAFSSQVEYLISLRDFSGGLFGGLGMHFYF